jgi:phosphonate transport system ATP-binding protein
LKNNNKEVNMKIVFDHVSKQYPNGYLGLNDVNLNIDDGEFVALIGPSGAGKTTLIRTINQMNDITSGEIHVGDFNVHTLDKKELLKLRQNVGMIFQGFNLIKRQTVLTNVLSGSLARNKSFKTLLGIFPHEEKKVALSKLDQVNLLDRAFNRADNLSGGQQQRVAIARVLMQNPGVILADEPVSALDPVTKREVMEYLLKINKELGITIIINIHDINLAKKYCSRIVGINAGNVVVDCPSSELDQTKLEAIYGDEIGSEH